MHILIIDDDFEGTEYLSKYLQLQGFTTYRASNGSEGLELLKQLAPDLVIMDVLLPDADGREICQQIRSFSDVPILMLTAFAIDIQDQVRAFNCGADDYLNKPIDFDLLKAHVIGLLRRTTDRTSVKCHPAYLDSHLMIDLKHQQVVVDGKLVSLSGKEYQLLELLVRNLNESVSISEICEELWSELIEDEKCSTNAYACIRRLRSKIEPDPHNPIYILSEYGFGYRFATGV